MAMTEEQRLRNLERMRIWRAKHPDYMKEYWQKNKAVLQAKTKRKYLTDDAYRLHRIEVQHIWYLKNKEKVRIRNKEYYQKRKLNNEKTKQQDSSEAAMDGSMDNAK